MISFYDNILISMPRYELEVLIEKESTAVNCNANRTKTVGRTVEHMNSF